MKDNIWKKYESYDLEKLNEICDDYRSFISKSKIEREVVRNSIKMAEDLGFVNLNKYIENNISLNYGDKVYVNNRNKSLALFVIGSDDITKGINILGAHVDSPRLDLKATPLYEDTDMAYLDTHYYGGIKKYQWTTIPLSMHGVIVKTNGEKIEINIGEDENDPIFTITDLLPHLAMEQMEKKLKNGVEGENLQLLVGSIPYGDEKISERVKLNILNILNQKYGITERDFVSSEIEIVPAFKPRSLGFDGGLVAAYGQDDKVCVYTALRAMMEIENPKRTAVCLFSDKEEIGSVGNTGMCSNIFKTFLTELLERSGFNQINAINRLFANSKMLSADVDAGVNPLYDEVHDKGNCAYVGFGMSVNKYTGSGGKYNSSDANAEYVAEIRNLFDANSIRYQIAELGKVDEGGGGTIAYILANQGVDVIDCGVPVISMHSPYEVTSKYDIYTAYRAYKAFLR